MYNSLKYKTKQFLFFLIKIAIVIVAFYFIYDKIFHNEHVDFNEFIDQLEHVFTNNYPAIILLFIFTLANWFFAIVKWQILAANIRKLSFYEAAQQSLSSLTASLFTPNRIGEYGAKAIYFEKGNRRKIMLLNLLNNMAQMFTTLLFGVFGFIYFYSHFKLDIDIYQYKNSIFIFAGLLFVIFFISLGGRKKIRGFQLKKIIDFDKKLTISVHIENISLSMVRYIIFSHQFYFLLKLFGVESDYLTLMALISTMYVLASLIPGLAMLDWLIKGSVAIWVFNFININELLIVTITLLMWLMNFGLPAIIGSYFVLNFNYATNK
jgi:hypothetical protein